MKGTATRATNIKPMRAIKSGETFPTLPVGGYVYGEEVATDIINFSHYYMPTGVRVELGEPCKAYKGNLKLQNETEPTNPAEPPDNEINLEDFDFVRQVREGIPNSAGGVDWGAWRYEGVKLMENLP